jgi:hypothetical protein
MSLKSNRNSSKRSLETICLSQLQSKSNSQLKSSNRSKLNRLKVQTRLKETVNKTSKDPNLTNLTMEKRVVNTRDKSKN